MSVPKSVEAIIIPYSNVVGHINGFFSATVIFVDQIPL